MHKIEEIRKLVKDITDSKELINAVKNFYFNENDPEYEKNRLDNICHVSIKYWVLDIYFITEYRYLLWIYDLLQLFVLLLLK